MKERIRLSNNLSHRPRHKQSLLKEIKQYRPVNSQETKCCILDNLEDRKYYVLFVDNFSRYSWIFPMQYKHEVFDNFIKLKLHVENLFSSTIKIFQSDGRSKYTPRNFLNYLTHIMVLDSALLVQVILNKMTLDSHFLLMLICL